MKKIKNKALELIRYPFVFFKIYILKFIALSWDTTKNWGDKMNPILIENISKNKVTYVPYNYSNFLSVGSVLQKANKNSTIWGSGFISPNEKLLSVKKICAVRGPLTAGILKENNISCPEIYGDPAVLWPLIYSPQINKKVKVGVIPHYKDKNDSWLKKVIHNKNIKIIDIENNDIYDFIDQILECENILSSSLHGLICAESYKIPCGRLIFSNKIIGGDFKFNDYRFGINGKPFKKILVNEHLDPLECISSLSLFSVKSSQKNLLKSFPYELKNFLIQHTT